MSIRSGTILGFIAGILFGHIVSALLFRWSWIRDGFWDFSLLQLLQLVLVGGIGILATHKLNTRSTNTNRLKRLIETLIEEYAAKLLATESQAKVYRDDPSEENQHELTAAVQSASQALQGLCSGMKHCEASLSFSHSTEQLKDLFNELYVIAGSDVRLSLPPKGGRPVLVHPAPDGKYRPTSHSKSSLCQS